MYKISCRFLCGILPQKRGIRLAVSFIISGNDKSAQRSAGIAARRALGAAERSAANAALCGRILALEEFKRAKTILVYAAFGGEADLAALIAGAERQGKTVAYPVCAAGYTLLAAVPAANGWETGAYGIRTPVLSRSALIPPQKLDLILVPCTAFDESCMRVGMGKGYYDRYLPQCTNAAKIGVAFEAQRVPRAACGKYDQRLDAFVTERRIYTCV